MLRLNSNASSPRLVLSDTIPDKYMLKAGSIVKLQGGIMHQDRKLWNDGTASWHSNRFIVSQDNASAVSDRYDFNQIAAALHKGVPPNAFRAFGDVNTLCPGRYPHNRRL